MNLPPIFIKLRKPFRVAVAALRLNKRIVCEESANLGRVEAEGSGRKATDFHDYPDSKEKTPDHFVFLTCERCGKRFTI
jgi:hypothetical protein